MEVNSQPTEGYAPPNDGHVDIVKVWLTIQGEGPQIGSPSVFIRLAGCNLQCPFCDTDYTSSRTMYSPSEVVELVRATRRSGLVVLTGGEPIRQNIGPMIVALLAADYRVQIETNGVLYRDNIPWEKVVVVCSPKTPKIHPELLPHINALKYVLAAGFVDEEDGLPTVTLGGMPPARPPDLHLAKSLSTIYIQPMDEQDPELNQKHVEAALESCYRFDYLLCLQTHKFIGLE